MALCRIGRDRPEARARPDLHRAVRARNGFGRLQPAVRPAGRHPGREAEERRDASGYTASRHHGWAGPGDGSRSRDEMRALDVLELEPDADFETIRQAWRRLAKENHPDVRPGDKEAAEEFQKLQLAYEVLRAAEDRREWKG